MQKTCIVIPCYNEQYRLPINKIIKSYETTDYHYLFVNDGSSDLTIKVLKKILTGRTDRVLILDKKQNNGKAEAVRQGVLTALRWKEFDIIGYLDADLSTPISDVFKIISHINKEFVFVFGSRVQRIGVNIQRKWYRHILGRVFASIASKMLNINVYDTQCGAKFFHIDIVEDIFIEQFKSNWVFDLEIFFRLLKKFNNKDINSFAKEMPLDNWNDVSGSKIKIQHYFKIPFEMLKLFIHFKK